MLTSSWTALYKAVHLSRPLTGWDQPVVIDNKISKTTLKSKITVHITPQTDSAHTAIAKQKQQGIILQAYQDFVSALSQIPAFDTPLAAPTLIFYKDGDVTMNIFGLAVDHHLDTYGSCAWTVSSLPLLLERLERLSFLNPPAALPWKVAKDKKALIFAHNAGTALYLYYQLQHITTNLTQDDLPKRLPEVSQHIPGTTLRKELKDAFNVST